MRTKGRFFVRTKGEENAAKFANFSIQVREFFVSSSRKLRVKFAQTLHEKRLIYTHSGGYGRGVARAFSCP